MLLNTLYVAGKHIKFSTQFMRYVPPHVSTMERQNRQIIYRVKMSDIISSSGPRSRHSYLGQYENYYYIIICYTT